jgi:hypothetical protein
MMEGPLAKHVSGRVSEIATSIHDVNAVILLSLIALHVVAVLFYLLARRQNLILPMVTGRMAGVAGPTKLTGPMKHGGPLRGAVILAAAVAIVYFTVTF